MIKAILRCFTKKEKKTTPRVVGKGENIKKTKSKVIRLDFPRYSGFHRIARDLQNAKRAHPTSVVVGADLMFYNSSEILKAVVAPGETKSVFQYLDELEELYKYDSSLVLNMAGTVFISFPVE